MVAVSNALKIHIVLTQEHAERIVVLNSGIVINIDRLASNLHLIKNLYFFVHN